MAHPLDVLTLAEAKEIVGIGDLDTGQDDLLARVVTASSRRLDECVGPVVQRSVTSEEVTAHGALIELSLGPVTAVSSVTEDGVALTATDWYAKPYRPDPTLKSGIIVRRISDYPAAWVCGLGKIQVGYLAGRFTSTTTVEARYKEGCALILRNLWRTYEANVGQLGEFDTPHMSFPAFATPKAVRDLFDDEWQSPVGFGA